MVLMVGTVEISVAVAVAVVPMVPSPASQVVEHLVLRGS
jgi:hypothetical protein